MQFSIAVEVFAHSNSEDSKIFMSGRWATTKIKHTVRVHSIRRGEAFVSLNNDYLVAAPNPFKMKALFVYISPFSDLL
tara:strand:- start:195 stop:428 length:234 start_codon:yes stop_codon:yes gene_type:complete